MISAGVANHARLTLVCWVVVFYVGYDNFPTMMVSNGTWLFEGLVAAGHDPHKGCLTTHNPASMVCASDKMFSPSTLLGDSLSFLVDSSVPGRFSQGAIAAGWVVAVAVNHILHVAGFSEHACDAPVICGDFGDFVLPDIWKQSYGISSWRFGLSCQPFSPLGDGRGPHDDRAWGLSLTMAATNSPQSWIMVIGCASPAGADAAANPNGMQCIGCPGPVRSGSWNDGCAVSHLHLGYSGLYQHTMWFITVLIQSLQHRLVGLSIQAARWYGDAVVRQLVSWF